MEHTTIWAALAAAQGEVSRVAKDSRNEHHRYRYASAEAVIDEARSALASAGLSLHCRASSLVSEATVETYATQDGEVRERPGERWRVECVYVLAHAGGETAEIASETPVIPDKGRPLDKALAAAKTYDIAYTLRSLLLISRGDETVVAVDQRDDRRAEAPAPRAPSVDVVALLDAATTAAELAAARDEAVAAMRGVPTDDPRRVRARAALARATDRIGAS